MSDSSTSKFSLSAEAKRNFGIGAIVLGVVGAIAGLRSYKFVDPNEFGLEVIRGKVQSEILKPDFYKKYQSGTPSTPSTTMLSFLNNRSAMEKIRRIKTPSVLLSVCITKSLRMPGFWPSTLMR